MEITFRKTYKDHKLVHKNPYAKHNIIERHKYFLLHLIIKEEILRINYVLTVLEK